MRKMFEATLLIAFFTIGCFSFGGQTVKPETIAKLETALKQAQDQIDKSSQAIEANNSEISTVKTNISNAISIQNNLQEQITNLTTVNNNHNESIKSLMWSVAGIWVLINVAKFIQMLIAAKVAPGHTFKNVFTLPWNKGKE